MNELEIEDEYVEIKDIDYIKQMLIHLLGEFHEICEENNLIYNVFGGTMLGAIRHNGMIPWDDDIDVTMPRPDYERLILLVRTKYNDTFCMYNYPQKNYVYPFAKFAFKDSLLYEFKLKDNYQKIGLYIDIFPVDGYPSAHENLYFAKLKNYKFLRCFAMYKSRCTPGILGKIAYCGKRIFSSICEAPGIKYYLKKEISLAMKYNFENTDYILCQGASCIIQI